MRRWCPSSSTTAGGHGTSAWGARVAATPGATWAWPPAALVPFLGWTRIVLCDLARMGEKGLTALRLPAFPKVALACMGWIRGRGRSEVERCLQRWGPLLRAMPAQDSRADVEALSSYVLYTAEKVTYRQVCALFAQQIGREGEAAMTSVGQKIEQKARRRGRVEGRVEGGAEILLAQLRARFGKVPAKLERRMKRAESKQLEQWALALLHARDLHDVFSG